MYITTQHISSFLKCLTVRNSLLELLCLTTRFLSDLWSNYYYWSLSLLLKIPLVLNSSRTVAYFHYWLSPILKVLLKFYINFVTENIYFIRHFYFLLNLITTLVKSIVIVSVPSSHVTTAIVTLTVARFVNSGNYWLIDWLISTLW